MINNSFWWKKRSKYLNFINIILEFLIDIKNILINPYKSKIKIICVGNLVVGGSGKTPMVRYLRKTLESKGYKCAVLLRGYGGSFKNPTKVIYEKHTSKEVGDEALMHARDGLTIISKNRVKGCKYLEEFDLDIIILDDGFQNLSLKKDFNLIVVSSNQGIGNNLIIPFGPLRESISKARERADIMIKSIFSEKQHYSFDIISNYFEENLKASYKTIIDENLNNNFILYTGIGDPAKFINAVKSNKIKLSKSFIFRDHQEISEKKAKQILVTSEEIKADILTTEKDLMRLLNSKKNSYREKLFLKSKIAKIQISLDKDNLLKKISEKLELKL